MKTRDELARITRLLRDDDVLCRDGTPSQSCRPPTFRACSGTIPRCGCASCRRTPS